MGKYRHVDKRGMGTAHVLSILPGKLWTRASLSISGIAHYMDKRVTLKLNAGTLETGFSVSLQIGDEDTVPEVEISGSLPPSPALKFLYQRWQAAYRRLGSPTRLEADTGFVTNVSIIGDCLSLAEELKQTLNQWLRSETFRPIQEKLLERLAPADTVRLILQTPTGLVQRLPWHLWEILSRYARLEIALSTPAYEKVSVPISCPREKVRILAIIGHSQGLDIESDQALLNRLPNAEVHFLLAPNRQTLNATLWDPKGWDILFFAGHSATRPCTSGALVADPEPVGQIFINNIDALTIEQLKHALSKALTRGLKIAIFNSCDGIGLAEALADLKISQILVMREPVSDPVAHAFLKSFLEAFARREPMTLAVKEAREKLQGLEGQYPCASWLPTLFQNPAERPPTWSTLSQTPPTRSIDVAAGNSPPRQARQSVGVARILPIHILTIVVIILLRNFGVFQGWELKAFDQFLHLRSAEAPDGRIVIVMVTEADVRAQDPEDRRGSLSDSALMALLNHLNPMGPHSIGLDNYRDYPVRANQPALATAFAEQENLFVVCKGSTHSEIDGIPPPPEVPNRRIGFSDFPNDGDDIVRRHLFSFKQAPTSPCQSTYALNTLLALNYLESQGFAATVSPEGELRVGNTLFKTLNPTSGSYRNMDASGYQLFLNYRNLDRPEEIAEVITLTELLAGKVAPESIRDRIVLIGTTADSFGDNWQTPYGQTKGVFMQAQMISQLISAVLNNRALITDWPNWAEVAWIVFWASTGSFWVLVLRASKNHFLRKLVLGLLVSELALLSLCWLLFAKAHTWVPWVSAAIAPIAVVSSAPIAHRLSNATSRQKQEPS